MRIVFSNEQTARAAVDLWEQHGFDATRDGTTVVTDCPTLWAVPVLERAIGLDQVRRLVVHDQRSPAAQHALGDSVPPGRRRTDPQPASGE
jgi:hypothetical protein